MAKNSRFDGRTIAANTVPTPDAGGVRFGHYFSEARAGWWLQGKKLALQLQADQQDASLKLESIRKAMDAYRRTGNEYLARTDKGAYPFLIGMVDRAERGRPTLMWRLKSGFMSNEKDKKGLIPASKWPEVLEAANLSDELKEWYRSNNDYMTILNLMAAVMDRAKNSLADAVEITALQLAQAEG